MEKRINFLHAVWLYKTAIIVLTLIGFLLAYFVTDFIVNQNYCYYQFEIETETAPSLIFNADYVNERISEIDDYNDYAKSFNESVTEENQMSSVTLSSGYDYAKIMAGAKITENGNNHYTVKLKQNTFKTTFVSSKQTASEGISKCETNIKKLFVNPLKYYEMKDGEKVLLKTVSPRLTMRIDNNIGFTTVNYNNPFIYGGLGALTMFIISIGLFFIFSKGKNKDYFTDIADNENIYNTPFHKSYWKNQGKPFKKVKDLCVLSILFAMMLVCKLLPIPSGFGSLGLSFTYLFFAIICLIYGPTTGLVIGILSDTLGYFINSQGGAFFPGYTLDAMAAGFMYGICFYKTKITFTKCLYARLFVNLIVNVIFGSLWYCIMYDIGFSGYLTYISVIALPKNILYLLPQAILLFIVLKAMMRPLVSFGLVDERIKEHVTLF